MLEPKLIRRAMQVVAAALLIALQIGATKAARLIDGSYFEDSSTVICGDAATECSLVFDPTPTDQKVLIRRVACAIDADTASGWSGRISVANAGSVERPQELKLTRWHAGSNYHYLAAAETRLLFRAERPHIRVLYSQPTETARMYCRIVGEMTPL